MDTREIEEELVAGKTRVFENSREYYEKVESLIVNAYRHMTGKIIGKKILVEKDIKGEVLSKLECPFCGVLVAWTEKRRPGVEISEEEMEEYGPIDQEREIILRVVSDMSFFGESEPLGERELREAIIDSQDTVYILKKDPSSECPGCNARITVKHNSIEKNIQELLKEAGHEVSLETIKKLFVDDYCLQTIVNGTDVIQYGIEWKFKRYRYYPFGSEGKRLEELRREHEEELKKEVEEEIVDEYGGREIHRRRRGIAMDFEDIRADMVADMVSREMREEIGQEAVREVLFYKDREKAVSFLQRVLGDYFFYQDDFVQSRNWFARSLRQDSKKGYSLSRLGIIDILEGREKEGVERVIKGGEIEGKSYLGDMGRVFRQRKEVDKAEKWLNEDFRHKKTGKCAFTLGYMKYEKGDIKGAIEFFHKSLELDHEWWDSYIVLGQLYCKISNSNQAKGILEDGMKKIIGSTEDGKFFYKDEEKAKQMHSLLKELKQKSDKG